MFLAQSLPVGHFRTVSHIVRKWPACLRKWPAGPRNLLPVQRRYELSRLSSYIAGDLSVVGFNPVSQMAAHTYVTWCGSHQWAHHVPSAVRTNNSKSENATEQLLSAVLLMLTLRLLENNENK
jgi:hypothetical protein